MVEENRVQGGFGVPPIPSGDRDRWVRVPESFLKRSAAALRRPGLLWLKKTGPKVASASRRFRPATGPFGYECRRVFLRAHETVIWPAVGSDRVGVLNNIVGYARQPQAAMVSSRTMIKRKTLGSVPGSKWHFTASHHTVRKFTGLSG